MFKRRPALKGHPNFHAKYPSINPIDTNQGISTVRFSMKPAKHLILVVVLALVNACVAHATPVSLTGAYSQNFDSLSASGTAAAGTANAWVNGTTILGWHLFRQPSPGTAITAYDAGTGSSTAGSFYSFGSTGSGERALGGVGSGGAYFGSPSAGSIAGWIAVELLNASVDTYSSFTAGWDGEQWRNGGNASMAAQTMVFEYGFGATFAGVSTWNVPGGSFDWASPVTSAAAAAVDGNVAGLVANRGGTINGLTWNPGQTLWLRWVERNDTGNDHGLAIDDFSVSAKAATSTPVPETLSLWWSAALLLPIFLFPRFRLKKV